MTSSNFQEWLQQGEALYQAALRDYQAMEAQLGELEQRLVAKQAEVNQIAAVIGKPAIEGSRRAMAQVVSGPVAVVEDHDRMPVGAANNANIARALAGRFGR